ncbi:MAG: YjbF family lipoprotein [Sphingobacteriales bacterium]|nr:YjbF family lipoprotein [Sphingobacteriales bacterium]MBD3768189.1 YjbF family lipoprotein [Gammaproteobacteria bacterium]
MLPFYDSMKYHQNLLLYGVLAGLVACTALLSGCGLTSAAKDESLSLSAVFKLRSLAKVEHVALSSQAAAQSLQYATLKAELDVGEVRALLVLAKNAASGQQWVGADGSGFTTWQGRITRYYTPALDLSRIEISPLYPQYGFAAAFQYGRISAPFELDNDTEQRFQVLGKATLYYDGKQPRMYWGKPTEMLQFSERIEVPSTGFTHVNYYWLDPQTFFVWESQQKWWPQMPLISIQVLKPWEAVRYP